MSWLGGGFASLNAASNVQLGVAVHIVNPPNAITDLVASGVGSQDGDIQLVWTAPSNANQISIDHYLIRYATYPAAGAGSAESWWTAQAATESSFGPAGPPGSNEFRIIPNLTLRTTYYFGIKSVDRDKQVSAIDTRTGTVSQAWSLPLEIGLITPPKTPVNFAGVALSSDSIRWSWNATTYTSYYEIRAVPSGTLIGQTGSLSLVETGLTPNTPISRNLTSVNGNGSSPPSSLTIYTLAQPPVNLRITGVSTTSIVLAWDPNGNPAGTLYQVERSLDGAAFNLISSVSTQTYTDTGLSLLTTYYYRVVGRNGDSVATAPSAIVSTVTLSRSDLTPPEAPLGLKGFLDPTGRAFTLVWEPPLKNTDGSPVTDLAGYHIYRRTSLSGTATRITPAPINVTAFADRVDGQTFYYTIHAVDTSGNESGDSFTADSSPLTNIIFLAPDGLSTVVMPDSINDLLRSAYNTYGVPLTISLAEQPVPSQTEIIRQIDLKIKRGDNDQEIKDFAFGRPEAIVGVGYNMVNGQVARGNPEVQSVSGAATGATPDQLSLYWNNGVAWVKVGGTLSAADQTIKTKSSYLGRYQLRITPRATSLSLAKENVYPRVFTPNGDGYNDRVYFVLENPNGAGVKGEIFDMQGRHVAALPAPLSTTSIGTTLVWDGKDSNGSTVPSGVYMYRIEGEGKTFTGTVAVAR